jgi:hypothetical protein
LTLEFNNFSPSGLEKATEQLLAQIERFFIAPLATELSIKAFRDIG